MQLPQTPFDDPAFIRLVTAYVKTYATLKCANEIRLIHVDNWFGERWLGFAGKFRGVAGIRQRRGKLALDGERSLAIPPFRPSRVLAYKNYAKDDCGNFVEERALPLHHEKNGGHLRTLIRSGLYAWYSGATRQNTTGCLMVYELNPGGEDGWYLQFSRDSARRWDVVSCRNTQLAECRRISAEHYAEESLRRLQRPRENDAGQT